VRAHEKQPSKGKVRIKDAAGPRCCGEEASNLSSLDANDMFEGDKPCNIQKEKPGLHSYGCKMNHRESNSAGAKDSYNPKDAAAQTEVAR
jgi:hypothetical protein